MANTKNRSTYKTLTTSNQDIYTVPPQWQAEITSIMLTNMSSSAVTVNLDWYDSESTTYFELLDTVTLQANSILQITDCLSLQRNDKLRALASAGSAINVTVKVVETSRAAA